MYVEACISYQMQHDSLHWLSPDPSLFHVRDTGIGIFHRLCSSQRETAPRPCRDAEENSSLIKLLLLQGPFFKESLCHEGTSQIHFPMAPDQRSRVSDLTNIPLSCWCFRWKGRVLSAVAYMRVCCWCVFWGLHCVIKPKFPLHPDADLKSVFISKITSCTELVNYPATLVLLLVSIQVDSWLLIWEAGALQHALNGLYGKSMPTYLSVDETLCYLWVPSPDRPAGLLLTRGVGGYIRNRIT